MTSIAAVLARQRRKHQYNSPHHLRLRRAYAMTVAAGLANCAECGQPIAAGAPWDLAHDRHDRTRYAGPAHRACNRNTAGVVARKSRTW